MEFLTSNLPLIVCGLAGIALLLTEAFLPGFGAAGILGVVLEIIAVCSAWMHHGTAFALAFTACVLLVIGLAVFLSYRSVTKGRLSKSNLILKDEELPEAESAASKLLSWKGREGVAVSALRPGGTVEIDGTRLNAASGGELVEKGTRVLVTGAEGDHVMVRPVQTDK